MILIVKMKVIIIVMMVEQECHMIKKITKHVRFEKALKRKLIFKYIMLLYDLQLDIKFHVLSYNLGDVRLLKI